MHVVATGFPVAGETAESPEELVAPVLAFCASAIEPVSTSIAVAVIRGVLTGYPPSKARRVAL
jgi:hypothetical protein